MMLRQYLPILIFMGLAGVLGLALFTIGWILGPRRPDAEKLSPYECGFEAFEDSRVRFDVRYYLVAIIFIVFDLNAAAFSLRRGRNLKFLYVLRRVFELFILRRRWRNRRGSSGPNRRVRRGLARFGLNGGLLGG